MAGHIRNLISPRNKFDRHFSGYLWVTDPGPIHTICFCFEADAAPLGRKRFVGRGVARNKGVRKFGATAFAMGQCSSMLAFCNDPHVRSGILLPVPIRSEWTERYVTIHCRGHYHVRQRLKNYVSGRMRAAASLIATIGVGIQLPHGGTLIDAWH